MLFSRGSDAALDAARYELHREAAARRAAQNPAVVLCANCGYSMWRAMAYDVDGEHACSRRCQHELAKEAGTTHAEA